MQVTLCLVLLAVVACGEAAPATPTAAATEPAATPQGQSSAPTAQPSPTPADQSATGELVADKISFVISAPTLSSALDCEITGSGTAQHRPGSEYLIDANRYSGELEPMLATEWSVSSDARTWTFKLREGVDWHFGFGEFTSSDVVNSLAYYTNDACKASYSSYFREDPSAIPEVVNDHEIKFHMDARPELFFDQMMSAYNGLPFTSKAQWDQGCPAGSAEYSGASESRADLAGYCVAGEEQVKARPARTGPYQLTGYEEFQSWRYERVPYDHYRVNPDFQELEVQIIKEAATRLAVSLAREVQLAEIDRALIPEATANGLGVSESNVPGVIGDMIFGGMYWDSNLADSYDPNVPWSRQDEAGKKVRMAMNKAINRDLIRNSIFDGFGAKHWVARFSTGFPGGYNPEWEKSWDELYGYDPDRARELLSEAGYPDGFDVRIVSYTMSGIPEMRDYVESIAAMWEAIGLKPEITEMEFGRWREVFRAAETSGYVYPFRNFSGPAQDAVDEGYSHGRSMRFYTSDSVTENIVAALDSTNVDEQNRRWHAISDEVFYNVGTMPLLSFSVLTVYDPQVVAEYAYLGNFGGNFTAMEYIKGVRR